MNFFQWFFSPRSKDDWKSWRSLFVTFPLWIAIAVGTIESHRYSDFASRENKAAGTIASYDRNNHNTCGYIFYVADHRYEGHDSASFGSAIIGEAVTVFYDSANPSNNSLEEFSAKAKRQNLTPFCLAGIAIVVLIIASAKMKNSTANSNNS